MMICMTLSVQRSLMLNCMNEVFHVKQYNSWTADPNHIDYVINYEELDATYSQLHLSELDTKTIARYGKRKVVGKDDKVHTSPLYICTEIYTALDIETSTIYTTNIINGK